MMLYPFGDVMPIHLDMLALSGYVAASNARHLELAVTEVARKAAMREGRRALCREMGRDFGYNLAAWRAFLTADRDSGYTLHSAFPSVDDAVRDAIDDRTWRRLAEELENEDGVMQPAVLKALLAEVHEAPDDDRPRLVLADWLEEHDEADRAELVRVQCALAARPNTSTLGELRTREKNLLIRTEKAWRAELGRLYYQFDRGLPTVGLRPDYYSRALPSPAEAAAQAPLALAAGWPGLLWLAIHDEDSMSCLERPPWLGSVSPLGLFVYGSQEDALLRVANVSQVRALYLCGDTNLTGKAVGHLRRMPRLDWVGLWNTWFSDNDLALLQHMHGLKILDLPGRDLTAECVPHLWGLKSLKRLRLKRNRFGDDDVRSLARMTGLTELELEKNRVGDAGLRWLARLPALERLNLFGNEVTDDGLPSAAECCTLRYLCVGETGVTSRGVARLREARPDLWVEC